MTVTTTDPLLDPRPPFGTTIAGVLALVPEARLDAGPRPIAATTVAAWLDELAARLELHLAGYLSLPADRLPGVITAARDAVHNGAASYLEAARFPERAGRADTSYAAVLWTRYTAAATELAAWLEEQRDTGVLVDTTPASDVTAPVGSFPPPSFTPERLRF